MIIRTIAMLLAVATLAACVKPPTVAAPRCDPARHRALIGQNIGAVTLPADLPQRIVSPGEILPPDRDPARLTIFVDPKGWIARVNCG